MIDAFTLIQHLPGQRRGDLSAYRIKSCFNGKRREITVLARTGRDALALFAHQMGDAAPKVAA